MESTNTSRVYGENCSIPIISEVKLSSRMNTHTSSVFEAIYFKAPNENKNYFATASHDSTIKKYDEEGNEVGSILFMEPIYSICQVKNHEKYALISSFSGYLSVIQLFPEFVSVRDIPVAPNGCILWKIRQISNSEFISCNSRGQGAGDCYLTTIPDFDNFQNIRNESIYKHPECLRIACQCKTNPSILFLGGGKAKEDGGKQFGIVKFDYESKKVVKTFPPIHVDFLNCFKFFLDTDKILTTKGDEVLVSGGRDNRIVLWTLEGEVIRNFGPIEERINCFLQKNYELFIGGYGGDDQRGKHGNFFYLDLKNAKRESSTVLGCTGFIGGIVSHLKWINPEKTVFLCCDWKSKVTVHELRKKKDDIVEYTVSPVREFREMYSMPIVDIKNALNWVEKLEYSKLIRKKDDVYLLLCTPGKFVKIFDTKTRNIVYEQLVGVPHVCSFYYFEEEDILLILQTYGFYELQKFQFDEVISVKFIHKPREELTLVQRSNLLYEKTQKVLVVSQRKTLRASNEIRFLKFSSLHQMDYDLYILKTKSCFTLNTDFSNTLCFSKLNPSILYISGSPFRYQWNATNIPIHKIDMNETQENIRFGSDVDEKIVISEGCGTSVTNIFSILKKSRFGKDEKSIEFLFCCLFNNEILVLKSEKMFRKIQTFGDHPIRCVTKFTENSVVFGTSCCTMYKDYLNHEIYCLEFLEKPEIIQIRRISNFCDVWKSVHMIEYLRDSKLLVTCNKSFDVSFYSILSRDDVMEREDEKDRLHYLTFTMDYNIFEITLKNGIEISGTKCFFV